MSLLKEEGNKLECQHMLLQNCILKLHSNKKKIQTETKCNARAENTTYQYQARYKRNVLRKNKNIENTKYVA
jgi:hypothetical protein